MYIFFVYNTFLFSLLVLLTADRSYFLNSPHILHLSKSQFESSFKINMLKEPCPGDK
jgi:hypothetical protein